MVFYALQLTHYTVVFQSSYNRCQAQLDDYYSDEESQRLLWVKHSFFLSLAVGTLALMLALVPTAATKLSFIVVALLFYTAFAIRFINYVAQFADIENAITADVDEPQGEPTANDRALMSRVDELMATEKPYCRPNLSVGDLAMRLCEKPRAISSAIKLCRQMNFKTYINEHRIAQAKRLLDEDRAGTRTIDAIASDAGFDNRSNFYRVFKASQGISPTDYRHRR